MSTAVVTGAGSGVGRAVAVALAREGWNVALVSRTESALRQTAALCPDATRVLVAPCDVSDAEAAARMMAHVLETFGEVQALVNAAGTNAPRRSLSQVSLDSYYEIVAANLHGSFHCVQALLPHMRQHRRGTIVNVVSIAGRQASSLSGVAYVVSKFGQAGLTQSINAEERVNGIRACSVFPGDINTPLLEKRPSPPAEDKRRCMLQAEDVAECVLLAIHLPPRAVVEEIVVTPQ